MRVFMIEIVIIGLSFFLFLFLKEEKKKFLWSHVTLGRGEAEVNK